MSELTPEPESFDPVDEIRRAQIEARLEEILEFATAAKEQGFVEDPRVMAYFIGRATLLGIQLGIHPEDGGD